METKFHCQSATNKKKQILLDVTTFQGAITLGAIASNIFHNGDLIYEIGDHGILLILEETK